MNNYVFINADIRHGFYKVLGSDGYGRPIIQALAVFWKSGTPWRKVAKGSHIAYRPRLNKMNPLDVINKKIEELEQALVVLKETKEEMESNP